jgi:hypothetical protein
MTRRTTIFAATREAFPRVGEGVRRDLIAKTGNEALASSRTRAVHVAMARKGKALGLAGVMLVDRNLAEYEYRVTEKIYNGCSYL